ncbi:hypothetical protein SAICODRAFT_4587 [Saitoella complicata NRRL Y-17804]|uniref:Uncharacterized protein n=1 Tax=Saitoella complicata (strain BCRC 22490 / CBS 7301 / JCM 7358 / NBRC 10748 / NRRL Y-17804) TaxID=698492 RepID=A0A0E9NQE8_SAICN|nr:uncharacterized protein SAICODRAFT_4587 [Saitoella complicata NRRL Y-17804]ODQ56406.1 hypothetical protein SAICODRAFT_4587 [Saitoella complicata NRRL Y-17804]GAO52102.1 hypothetical protein G7K_6188-t1 [Saitoella complicata NRRL Y-17804]
MAGCTTAFANFFSSVLPNRPARRAAEKDVRKNKVGMTVHSLRKPNVRYQRAPAAGTKPIITTDEEKDLKLETGVAKAINENEKHKDVCDETSFICKETEEHSTTADSPVTTVDETKVKCPAIHYGLTDEGKIYWVEYFTKMAAPSALKANPEALEPDVASLSARAPIPAATAQEAPKCTPLETKVTIAAEVDNSTEKERASPCDVKEIEHEVEKNDINVEVFSVRSNDEGKNDKTDVERIAMMYEQISASAHIMEKRQIILVTPHALEAPILTLTAPDDEAPPLSPVMVTTAEQAMCRAKYRLFLGCEFQFKRNLDKGCMEYDKLKGRGKISHDECKSLKVRLARRVCWRGKNEKGEDVIVLSDKSHKNGTRELVVTRARK